MSEVQEFGITEFKRRIRLASKVIRTVDPSVRVNSAVELGSRVIPVTTPRRPTVSEAFPAGDDLVDYLTLNDDKKWLSEAGMMQHGAVVHVYFSNPHPWGFKELVNVFTVWVGTPDEEPVLIDAPACQMPSGHGPALDTTGAVD